MVGERWYGLPCYEFNDTLNRGLDDWRCVHCRKFLTVECPYIDEMVGEGDDDDEEG